MNRKQLYALCYVLMNDDHPTAPEMTVPIRNCLHDLAMEEAIEQGFRHWLEWYLQAEMPFTEAEVKAEVRVS